MILPFPVHIFFTNFLQISLKRAKILVDSFFGGCLHFFSKMNARSHVFEIAVEARQVEEAISSIIHTVLFHRSFGKITYQNDRDYCEKTIGYEDVDCDYIGGNF